MKTWYVDFSGYCEIVAESEQDAHHKFWELISGDEPLPSNIYEITHIEEKGD